MRGTAVLAIVGLAVGACSGGGAAAPTGCADVVGVAVERESDGRFTFHVSVRSADTGWEKYADRWEVVAPDGTVLATRVLTHPHVEEQPFTRSTSGVAVGEGVDRVTIRARDSVEGFCGREPMIEIIR